ncbi:hypothetical protein MPTK1_1g07770 [Marchantia polymorpha subsp. ruderalis]|uniref:Calcineurin-like phosphoesterase domain-containing protein n=2 Tax=Marchantia polymorpha TaxID=3197 RepID=A0AAF6AMP1_MARPO|nr:hypothetical protein MARPO_0036s0022 [Marchantia polymorpha]BBM97711.1 hypothetical protein Mp_1g07770 [Marchantia polymorpha subsp. ruderalis]|eukprot:PTQ41015.1 hypothetical protein MARPO_0036s0022 [Marchantia polymorpha]
MARGDDEAESPLIDDEAESPPLRGDEAESPSRGTHGSSTPYRAARMIAQNAFESHERSSTPYRAARMIAQNAFESHERSKPWVCQHVPAIYGSFVDVLFDHAVGNQVLGPTKNPCPAFFRSPVRGDVWSAENWGHYPAFEKDPITKVPAAERLVAVGDLHGDFQKTEEVLKLANVLSDTGNKWCGGKTVLVQVGDIIDRGGGELKIYHLFEKLRREAPRHGGAVYCIHGNHEVMNMLGRFRYTSKEAREEFSNYHTWYLTQNALKRMVKGTDLGFDYMQGMPPLEEVENIEKIEPQSKTWNAFVGRILCMRPGGPFCPRFLGHYSTLLIVGKSFFVHGGIRDEQVPNGMQDLVVYNQKVSQWVKGLCQEHQAPGFVEVKQGFVWNRDYGVPSDIPCQNLAKLLGKFQCRRLMIGHTIQPAGINAVCKGKAIRIDVGMSKGCGGREPQALEVLDDERVNVLSRTGSTVLDVRADTEILKFKKSDPDNDDDDDSGASSSKPRMNLTPSKRASMINQDPADDAPLQGRCTIM